MGRVKKVLARMRANPNGDWRIDDFKTIADALKIEWDHDGTSHAVFRAPGGAHVSIPAHKPIKPVYVRKFLVLVDGLEKSHENS